ncbi:MAG: glutamate-5-semialdehyde dehydrogenase [Brevundimonas sp.]|nr:glutamate-5-semialdehyde dehydrogenase [Brevundimonas sp.]MDZ4060700.1 glutamate-5-semialdehyde dehydrogenase [Brevundimonas sp.]
MTAVESFMTAMGEKALAAAEVLRTIGSDARARALLAAADALAARSDLVLEANAADVARARERGLEPALIDRLSLNVQSVRAMATAIADVAALPDPVGRELARWTRPNGLDIARVSTPIGVIAIIYESRPNVTADAAALCLRSGNAAILRCGSDCLTTSLAIHAAFVEGLESAGLPAEAIQLVPTPDRAAVGALLRGLDGAVKLLVPRGGKSLVARVQAEARAPVLGHLEGVCHTYLHADADLDMAVTVAMNGKMRRVAICSATETLLVDAGAADRLLPPVAAALTAAGCTLRGDPAARAIVSGVEAADEADWGAEYLAAVLAVRVVDGLTGAIDHIRKYGSGHTETIVTENGQAAEAFLDAIDSAVVMWNASTQFSDGGEFGFGAEIGISTSRLHARGPVGAEQLTSYKYVVRGVGQTRG